MILLGGKEHRERLELRHDRIVEDVLGLELADHLFRDAALVIVVIEDSGAILRADVAALTIERGRIVNREKDAEQLAVRNLRGVVGHLHRLGVAGRSGADGLVARIRDVPTRVPRRDLRDTAQLLERRFEAPKAAAGECGEFHDASFNPARVSSNPLGLALTVSMQRMYDDGPLVIYDTHRARTYIVCCVVAKRYSCAAGDHSMVSSRIGPTEFPMPTFIPCPKPRKAASLFPTPLVTITMMASPRL